jgi:tetratricopeptide (TPR) repeat protein
MSKKIILQIVLTTFIALISHDSIVLPKYDSCKNSISIYTYQFNSTSLELASKFKLNIFDEIFLNVSKKIFELGENLKNVKVQGKDNIEIIYELTDGTYLKQEFQLNNNKYEITTFHIGSYRNILVNIFDALKNLIEIIDESKILKDCLNSISKKLELKHISINDIKEVFKLNNISVNSDKYFVVLNLVDELNKNGFHVNKEKIFINDFPLSNNKSYMGLLIDDDEIYISKWLVDLICDDAITEFIPIISLSDDSKNKKDKDCKKDKIDYIIRYEVKLLEAYRKILDLDWGKPLYFILSFLKKLKIPCLNSTNQKYKYIRSRIKTLRDNKSLTSNEKTLELTHDMQYKTDKINDWLNLYIINFFISKYTQVIEDLKSKMNTNDIQLVEKLKQHYMKRVALYEKLGKHDLAIQDCKSIQTLDPNNVFAKEQLVFIYSLFTFSTNLMQSVEYCTKIIKLQPNDKQFYIRRADAYIKLEQWENAVSDYRIAYNLDIEKNVYLREHFQDVLKKSAYKTREQKKYDDSIKYYNEAINLVPNDPYAYFGRGMVYKIIKKFELALKDFSRAIELKSDYILAYNTRGLIYLQYQMYDEAIRDFKEELKLSSDILSRLPVEMIEYIISYLNIRDALSLSLINKHINEILKNDSLWKTIYENEKGECSDNVDLAYDNNEKRLTWYEKCKLVYISEDVGVKKNKKNIHTQKPWDKDPTYHFRKASENLTRIYNILLDKYLKENNYKKSLEILTELINLNPNNSRFYNQRGIIYFKFKEYSKAMLDFSNAINLNAHYAEAYYNRGCIYEMFLDYKNALRDYNYGLINGYETAKYMHCVINFVKRKYEYTKNTVVVNEQEKRLAYEKLKICNSYNIKTRSGLKRLQDDINTVLNAYDISFEQLIRELPNLKILLLQILNTSNLDAKESYFGEFKYISLQKSDGLIIVQKYKRYGKKGYSLVDMYMAETPLFNIQIFEKILNNNIFVSILSNFKRDVITYLRKICPIILKFNADIIIDLFYNLIPWDKCAYKDIKEDIIKFKYIYFSM